MSGYHLVVAYVGTPMAEIHYPTHLAGALIVLFGLSLTRFDGSRGRLGMAADGCLIAMTVAPSAYLVFNAVEISNRLTYATDLTTMQTAMGVVLVIVLLEAARRTVGWALVILTVVFLFYALFGNVFPEPFWHRGYALGEVIELAYLTTDGIWNIPIAVTANFIFLFVLLGTLLLSSGAGTFFTDMARALTGRTVGGPAKTAVVASAFMGMLSGSSPANVVTTGAFTIPAMKRSGYPATFAAGVEAVASSGGQLTPPIMGAAAFLMIEFVGVSYADVIGFALMPAILYFVAVFAMVDLEARRLGLGIDVDDEMPAITRLILKRGYLVLPMVVMIYLLFEGYTPTAAGLWSVISLAILVVVLDPENRRNARKVFTKALLEAPRVIAPVSVACAIGGILAGVITMTGLGLKVSNIVLQASHGITIVALVLTMIVAVILGMGMPTSAAYIILATLLAPGLAKIGVPLVAAHMFIIYCAAKSSITPPVAVASYAAAAIADSDPWKTSISAFKLGISVFIIPYMFVYGPALLGFGDPVEVAWTFATAVVGILALSVASIGWLVMPLTAVERLIALAAAFVMIYAGWLTDVIGFALLAVFAAIWHLRLQRIPVPSAVIDGRSDIP